MIYISLPWQFAKGTIAPIIGATKAEHFDDAVGALTVKFTNDIAYLV